MKLKKFSLSNLSVKNKVILLLVLVIILVAIIVVQSFRRSENRKAMEETEESQIESVLESSSEISDIEIESQTAYVYDSSKVFTIYNANQFDSIILRDHLGEIENRLWNYNVLNALNNQGATVVTIIQKINGDIDFYFELDTDKSLVSISWIYAEQRLKVLKTSYTVEDLTNPECFEEDGVALETLAEPIPVEPVQETDVPVEPAPEEPVQATEAPVETKTKE